MSGALDWQMLAANVALQSLVLTALGWGMVRYVMKDARRRAWMAVLVAVGACVLPWLSPWMPQRAMMVETKIESVVTAERSVGEITQSRPKHEVTLAKPMVVKKDEVRAEPRWWERVSWLRLLVGGWAVGMMVLAVRLMLRGWRVAMWRDGLRKLPDEWAEMVPMEARNVMFFSGVGSPCVVGLWHPVIAVPEGMVEELSVQQWRWVLRHEGAHVAGHDTRVAWMLEVLRVGFWWNPFLHGLIACWAQAREEVCDAAAEHEGEKRQDYARFLLTIAEAARGKWNSTVQPVLSMAASRPTRRLKARLMAILEKRGVRSRVGGGFASVALLVMGILMVPVSWLGFGVVTAQVQETTENAVGAAEVAAKHNRLEAGTLKEAEDFPDYSDSDLNLSEVGRPKGSGRTLPEGSKVVPAAEESIPTTKTPGANPKKVANLQSKLEDIESLQFHIASKLVEMPASTAMPEEMKSNALSPEQFEAALRKLRQKDQIHTFSLQSVTAKPRTEVKMEWKRRLTAASEETGSEEDYLGFKQWMWLDFSGDQLELNLTNSVATVEGKGLIDILKPNVADPSKLSSKVKVNHLTLTQRSELPSGHTKWFEVGETSPGRKVYLFVTVTLKALHGEEAINRRRVKQPYASEGANMAAANRGRRLRLKMQLIEKPFDPKSLFNGAELGLKRTAENNDGRAKEKDSKKEEDSLIPLSKDPASHALCGVLTAAQIKKILQQLETLDGVTIYPERVLSMGRGNSIKEAVAEELKRPVGEVDALIEADGRTVNLKVSFPEEPATLVTHSLSLWNGQTVCFTDAVVGTPKGQRHQLILITPEF